MKVTLFEHQQIDVTCATDMDVARHRTLKAKFDSDSVFRETGFELLAYSSCLLNAYTCVIGVYGLH
ncbi:hypothetical protein WS97_28245 [Burkholderia territorii]|nr:hypothetical protein WS97_28245 [Burkholderia territorii]